MNLKLQLGELDITVVWDATLPKEIGGGLTKVTAVEIDIDPGGPNPQETFLHELLHAINLGHLAGNLDEETISILSENLYKALLQSGGLLTRRPSPV